jgi:hypothetical protein
MLIVIASASPSDEDVLQVLINWGDAGLVTPFVWCHLDQSGSLSATLVDEVSIRGLSLADALQGTSDNYQLVRLCLKKATEKETATGVSCAKAVLELLDNSVPKERFQDRAVLIATDTLSHAIEPGYDSLWPKRLLLLPSEKHSPNSFTGDIVKEFPSHVAHGIVALFGLWRGLTSEKSKSQVFFDSTGSNSNEDVVVVQPYTRMLEFPTLVDGLVGVSSGANPEYRNPDFRNFEMLDISSNTKQIADMFFESYSALIPVSLEEVKPEARYLTRLQMLKDIFIFARTELMNLPRNTLMEMTAGFRKSFDEALEELYPGVAKLRSDPSRLNITQGRIDAASIDIPDVKLKIQQGDSTQLWSDYKALCIGLIDGSAPANPLIKDFQISSRAVLAIDANSIVPNWSESEFIARLNHLCESPKKRTDEPVDASELDDDHDADITEEVPPLAAPLSIAESLITGIESYLSWIDEQLRQEFIPPVPPVASGESHPSLIVAKLRKILRIKDSSEGRSPGEIRSQMRRGLRRRVLALAFNFVVGITLFVLTGPFVAFWIALLSFGAIFQSVGRTILRGIKRERSIQLFIEEFDRSRLNFAVRRSKLVAEHDRFLRRLAQALDWSRAISMLIHHPWSGALGESVSKNVEPSRLSEGVVVGSAVMDQQSVRQMESRFAHQLFRVGWLKRRLELIESEILDDIAKSRGVEISDLGSPEGDDNRDANSLRSKMAQGMSTYLGNGKIDGLLLRQISEFIQTQRLDQLAPQVAMKNADSSVKTTLSKSESSVEAFFEDLQSPAISEMPAAFWNGESRRNLSLEHRVMAGQVSTKRIQIINSSVEGKSTPARLMLCRIDYSERRVGNLATNSEGWRVGSDDVAQALTAPEITLMTDDDFNNG